MDTTILATKLIELEQEPPSPSPQPTLTMSSAELAECTCPDWCERDHDRD